MQSAPPGASKPKSSKAAPPIEKITEHLYRVGTALVDTVARTVTCPGSIDMHQGPIEYLAVTPKGKTYESLLKVDVKPLYLQVALLLLGLKPENVLRYQGDPHTPKGAPVDISVKWRDGQGAEHEVRAESLLIEMPQHRVMPLHHWVFTGSRILKTGFEADICGSLAAVWHDPAAMLDNPLPQGHNDWEVNPVVTPPQGTPVQVVFHAAAPGQ